MLINGTSGNDDLKGTKGNDTISGGTGNDTILGGTGDDQISFDQGAKIVDGEAGNDVVKFDFSGESANFSLVYNSTDGSVISEGILSGTTIKGVEQFNAISGGGNDNINISGASIGSNVSTNNGNDYIIGSNGNDKLVTGAGDDRVISGEKNDTIDGGIGKDILNGESGNDLITFGKGEKTVNGGGGKDRVDLDFSGESKDLNLTYNQFKGESLTEGGVLDGTTIEAIEQVDLVSGSGDDFIDVTATTVGSTLNGGLGYDSLVGGLGDDTIRGGGDNDTFFGGSGSDQIDGGEGNSDVAVFSGDRDDYDITVGDDGVTVVSEGDTDNLSNIEYLRFDNGDFNLETEKFSEKQNSANEGEVKLEATASSEIVVNGEAVYFSSTNEVSEETLSKNSAKYVFDSFDTQVEGTIPVYDLYDSDLDTHFYTVSAAERDTLLESPDVELQGGKDGIAFYVELIPEI
jgi:Ca2+-binding RTX toxin-like protein